MITAPQQPLESPAPLATPASHGPFAALPVSVQPEQSLLTYYLLRSLLLGPFFLFMFIPGYFRWRSLRYDVDDEGITMRWGILFRKEVSITYARIQDIHLSSNVVERWLGLATIQVQTASGSAEAEMTVEGLRNHEAIRDFFYERMRGAKDSPARQRLTQQAAEIPSGSEQEVAAALRMVAAEIRALRSELPRRTGGVDGA